MVRRSDIEWHLELNEGIDLAIYLFGVFERSAIHACVKILDRCHQPVVFDIGANIGAYTLPLAAHVDRKGGMVHAFEPTRWAYKKLSRNLSANPGIRETVKARQVFLTSPVSPQVPIQVESSWPLHNSEGVNSLHGGKANDTDGALSFTLDEYVKAEGIQKLNLI